MRRALVSVVAALLVALAMASATDAQTTTVISGIVLKPNNSPASGVVIRIVKATKSGSLFSVSPATTTTASDGTFSINAPRGPNAYVWISAATTGFNTPSGTAVSVPDSATAQLQLLQAVTSPPAFLSVLVPSNIAVKDNGTSVTTAATILNFSGATVTESPTGQVNIGVAPSSAKFILQQANSSLANAQALGGLGTGLLKNTTTTGVLSIAGASDLPSGIDAAKVGGGAVSNTEFGFLDGVSSSIQTQISAKLNTDAPVTPGTYESTLATGYLLTGPAMDGLFRPSTGALDFPNSNIGIKISTPPQSALDVNGGVAVGSYAGSNAAPSNSLIVSGSVGVGTSSPDTELEVVGTVTATSFAGSGSSLTGVVTGTGTTGTYTKWSNGAGGVIANSFLSETADDVVVASGKGLNANVLQLPYSNFIQNGGIQFGVGDTNDGIFMSTPGTNNVMKFQFGFKDAMFIQREIATGKTTLFVESDQALTNPQVGILFSTLSGSNLVRMFADPAVGTGNLFLTNTASGTTFTSLTFGTALSSNPQLRVSGAGLQVRLGDNSAGSFLQATSYVAGGANGETLTVQTASELVTLDTGASFTDTTANLLPANAVILSVTYRVTTSITGVDSTALQAGDAAVTTRFGSQATLTSGATLVGLNQLQGAVAADNAGPVQISAAKVRLTLAGGADNIPSAGAVRVVVNYISLGAPAN